MKKKVLPVSLTKAQFSHLRDKALTDEVSMSHIIRELINKDIKENEYECGKR